ncbi:MAG: DNA mismatch repair endonuclease MutL [Spirochaetota bacterium]|nr:DNA mismatch repair endonuclease MutL [Spirochaetota bacterium]
MGKIKILPELVKKMIAAGEVVEGPFSVVKELIENSIDAESTEIEVQAYDSGFKKIIVRDNGFGICRDDLPLVIVDHATSKISDINDIDQITSFGFRGEALSSISSISKLTVLTKSADEKIGSRLENFNDNDEISDYAGPRGTTIIVENLFYNTPARKKFQKAKSTELRKIREIFIKLSLANPQINFSFSVDQKRELTLGSVESYDQRIEQIYGNNILENLYFDRLKDIKVEVSAFLSKPHFLKSSRSMQLLYVNKRVVDNKFLGFHLSKAYQGIAEKGKHPVAFIFLTIDPNLVDVNIHPAKREVKFFDGRYIDSMIYNLSKKILGKQAHNIVSNFIQPEQSNNGCIRNADIQIPEYIQYTDRCEKYTDESYSDRGRTEKNENTVDDNPMNLFSVSKTSYRSFTDDVTGLYKKFGSSSHKDEFRILGVVYNTYILTEKDDAINIIDFHAAHERFIYDSLITEESDSETQTLIFPTVIELSFEDYQIVVENKDFFLQLAFDIDSFSDRSIVIRGIPVIANNLDVEGFLLDVIESLRTDNNYIKDIKKIIVEKIACHSAIRSGDNLSPEDAKEIAYRVFQGEHELRCPHGRPYLLRLEKKDLERLFKRL